MSTSAGAAPIARSDDTIPTGYLYSWSPGATLRIQEYVAKYKPSMVQNDGTKPWLWVRREEKTRSSTVEDELVAVVEAVALLQQVSERVEEIKNDASIPVRGSKKAGTQSKKEVREQVQLEATGKLRDISKKYGFTCGKWLIFAPVDKVDAIWSKIAISLASGPLACTSAFCAKVSTSLEHTVPGYQHVICVYIPDVYDKEDVTAVMKVLLRQHGLNLSGVKSDLYTTIGLDSKHPSGIPSTVWKNVSLLKESEIKELKEAYYAELSQTKTTTTDSSKSLKPAEGKSKPLLKRKALEDPFASDEETRLPKNGKSADVGEKDAENGSKNGNKFTAKKMKGHAA